MTSTYHSSLDTGLSHRLATIHDRIDSAARKSGRSGSSVRLVGICKTVTRASVNAAYAAGLREFGENRVDMATEKFAENVPEDLILHMVGPLRTDDLANIAGRFALIHSLGEFDIADELNRKLDRAGIAQPVLLQINVGREIQKHGCSVDDAPRLLDHVLSLDHLEVQGFMTMAPYHAEPEETRPVFAEMREVAEKLRSSYPDASLDVLSMGMTNDFEVAVEEGFDNGARRPGDLPRRACPDVRFFSFGSGSSGNAFLLDTGDARIMFDCGIGIRRLRKEMQGLGVAGRLDGIVISHEHSDHIRALQSLLRYESCPVYASAGTFDAIGRRQRWVTLPANQRSGIAGIDVTPIRVSHDAAEPFGYAISNGAEHIALFTDLGVADQAVFETIAASSLVVLESNYCESMLRRSAYPSYLKRRIRSQHGHLSNDDCAATLVSALTARTRAVWLAHLSENNNAPEIAENTAREALALQGRSIPVQALPRFETADLFEVSGDVPSWQATLL